MHNLIITRKFNLKQKLFSFLFIGIFCILGIVLLFQNKLKPKIDIQYKTKDFNEIPKVSSSELDSRGVMICNATTDQINIVIVNDGQDGAIIVWQDSRTVTSHIYAQHITGNGVINWGTDGNGTLISGNVLSQSFPQVCSDGYGGAFIIWKDVRSGNQDIYAQYVNAEGITYWKSDGIVICNATGTQDNFQIMYDGNHGAIIVWQDERNVYSGKDIYAQRINIDGELQWGDNGTVICNATGLQFNPRLVDDDAGGAIFAWLDYRKGISGMPDIYMQRVNDEGNSQWGNNGTAICNVTSMKYYLELTNDGMGGAVAVWSDNIKGNYDIYAQLINTQGKTQWDANGTVICNKIGNQINIQIINSGNEGTIITWEDNRIDDDIYAQLINNDGISQWGENGTVICNVTGFNTYPRLISDDAGGAIIIWTDTRNGNSNIYAQYIWENGTTKWGTDGIKICNLDVNQDNPRICINNAGDTIIVWTDTRNKLGRDIYAQKLFNDPPTASATPVFVTWNGDNKETQWILQDDGGSGLYRVVADFPGGLYVCADWTSWENDVALSIPVNKTAFGTYNYTIEYTDCWNLFGISNTVEVTMRCLAICGPGPSVQMVKGAEDSILNWLILDTFSDIPSFKLYCNDDIVWEGPWTTDRELIYSVSDRPLGIYNFTLIVNEGILVVMEDTTIVTIISQTEVTPTKVPSNMLIIILSAIIISILGVALVIIILSQRQLSKIRLDLQTFTTNLPNSRNKSEK